MSRHSVAVDTECHVNPVTFTSPFQGFAATLDELIVEYPSVWPITAHLK